MFDNVRHRHRLSDSIELAKARRTVAKLNDADLEAWAGAVAVYLAGLYDSPTPGQAPAERLGEIRQATHSLLASCEELTYRQQHRRG